MTLIEKAEGLKEIQFKSTVELLSLVKQIEEFEMNFNLSDDEQWWLDNYRNEIERRKISSV